MFDRWWQTFDLFRAHSVWASRRFSFEDSRAQLPRSVELNTAATIGLFESKLPSRPPTITRGVRVPRSWIVACVVLSIIYLATSGIPTLFDQIDGQYAGAAREMIDRG